MKVKTEIATVPGLIRHIVEEIHPDTHPFLLHKVGDNWTEITYGDALITIDAVSAWLLNIGVKKGNRLVIIVENGPDYIYFDQALQQIGAVNTSVSPLLDETDIQFILNDSGAKTILIGNSLLFRKVLAIANNCPELMYIIPVFEGHEKYNKRTDLTASVISFEDLISDGAKLVPQYAEAIITAREDIHPSDPSCLIYPSDNGHTPKGIMLTHYNLTANIWDSLAKTKMDRTDVFLSFLPLSYLFERTATYQICLGAGCKIAFTKSLKVLADDLAQVKPTVMNCVPLLLEVLYDGVLRTGTAFGGMKAEIFNWGLKASRQYGLAHEAGTSPGAILSASKKIAEILVLNKIKQQTGGRLKLIFSGGGIVPKNVAEFFYDLGIKVHEEPDLTRISSVNHTADQYNPAHGTVGRVIKGIEVAIQDVETKRIYTVQTHESFVPTFNSQEGEILVRGLRAVKGSLNKLKDTTDAIDQDGWFHTGTTGRYIKGNLQIIGKVKMKQD